MLGALPSKLRDVTRSIGQQVDVLVGRLQSLQGRADKVSDRLDAIDDLEAALKQGLAELEAVRVAERAEPSVNPQTVASAPAPAVVGLAKSQERAPAPWVPPAPRVGTPPRFTQSEIKNHDIRYPWS